jgi:O-antigen ligase
MLAGAPVVFGVLGLLPGLVLGTMMIRRCADQQRRPWRWGNRNLVLPLMGLTLLVLTGLDASLTWRTVVQLVGVGLMWLVLLFAENENPNLVVPLALVLLIQGSVALAQFVRQSDLGLGALGELALDPEVQGVSVLWAGGQRWLRGYGLTSHPNLLGASLVIFLLFLLQPWLHARGWRLAGLTTVISIGILGLLATFSRTSWLALGAGLAVWAAVAAGTNWPERREWPKRVRERLRPLDLPVHLIIPIVLAAIFLLVTRDLVTSRFVRLDTPIEAHSLDERQRDSDLALTVIAAHPLRGVGAGNYLPSVRAIEPDSRPVHNVPLLATAELGLLGAALLLWFTFSGLRTHTAALAPWVAMLVIGVFDNTLWLTTSWRAAIIVGLLVAHASATDQQQR